MGQRVIRTENEFRTIAEKRSTRIEDESDRAYAAQEELRQDLLDRLKSSESKLRMNLLDTSELLGVLQDAHEYVNTGTLTGG